MVNQSVQFQEHGYPDLSGGQGTGANDFFSFGLFGDLSRDPIPRWWTPYRDIYFRQYVQTSSVLSGILYSRTTAIKNLDWQIVADDKKQEILIPFYVDLLNRSQFGEGFRSFVHRWVLDYYSQDNGAFVELVGQSAIVPYLRDGQVIAYVYNFLPKDKITDIQVFDSGQCYRTPDSEYPVIYTNPWFAMRSILHWSRVHKVSQFTSNLELSRGLGICAVSRALEALNIIRYSNEYITEKMTGESPEIVLAKNVAIKAIQQALSDSAMQADAAGRVRFKGFTFINATDTPNGQAELVKTELKTTPDGWDRWKEVTLAMYMIAMAFGTDVRDLGFPAQHTGETKADAEIQDLKTSNRGRADAKQELEDLINLRVLPRGLRFEFDFKDDLEDMRKAEITNLRNTARVQMLQAGMITADEARQIAVQAGDIPAELLNTVRLGEGAVQPMTTADESQDVGTKTINTYHQALIKLVNQYRKKEIGKTAFKEQMRALIAKQFRLGWIAGARTVDALDAVKFPDSDVILEGLIDDELAYIQEFADAVQVATKAITLADITRRLGIWANQFERLKNRAMLFFGGEKRLMWREGDTVKKCVTCVGLDGQVRTANEWARLNIQPQDKQLECGGWNCDCSFVVTNAPLTNSPLPPLGTKAHHNHEHDKKLQRLVKAFNDESTMIALPINKALDFPLVDSVEPVEPDSYHITLVYLPNGDNPDLSSIPLQKVKLKVSKSEVWDTKDGYCLVLRPDENPALKSLQKQALEIVKSNGLEFSEYANDWKPHITLGYSQTPIDPITFEPFELELDKLVLEQWGDNLQEYTV